MGTTLAFIPDTSPVRNISNKTRTTKAMSRLIVPAILLFFAATTAVTSAAQTQTKANSTFGLEPLWATQVDPRWRPGDSVGDVEDGITAEFVEFSADGKLLITGNGLGEAFVLNASNGAVEQRFSYITEQDLAGRTEFDISGGKTKGMEVECGAFTPDGRFVVLGGNLNGVKVFDLRNGSLVRHIKVAEEVDGLGISPDGRFFAHAAPMSAQVYHLPHWNPVASVRHGDKEGVTNSIDFTPDAGLMVSAGNYGHVILTRTPDWRQVGDGLIPKTSSIKSVRFSPDTRLVAAGYGGADCAAVYRTKDMSLLKHLPLFYIEAVAWTSDGRFLMAGGRDEQGCIRVFRMSDWQLAGAPKVQADRSNIEYIDVHGERVAVAGEDAHVRLYRVQ
ncbi:MAG: WD40 repeat domain-containing protein [Phycisphaerales bacterium]|nr:MAG: WD40 repeat domain-containing protein [Phycisphaerales bacterium]